MILAWGIFLYGVLVVVVRLYHRIFKSDNKHDYDLLFGIFLALASAQYIWG